ncbi:uncharacterized protein PHALS_12235 [Plasmopara halstedii]|uniref:Uncharacterized protein n=1 Tax=Plasmopara halstedii TaxID=4781 RepID=A0A0N7L5M9_PLAHL|nr:uncharacterized protein PHALS_12235 [Plasmopara halstedii]CEG41923.1 hypothetical protein PHALS_12235 [Plasmopara halstedii]|eukprot:XP_024578292.1 hypothetical protein PHALS_12235 [Plasmopara halstedii]
MEETESQRDTIVAWLEQNDNFQRATILSGLVGSKQTRSDVDYRQAEQTERQALNDLAAAVNASLPRSMWDCEYAKQMLQRYLALFKATATQASQPGFSLSRTDKVFGIKSIEDKLNSMCPHFIRLQALCNKTANNLSSEDVERDRCEEINKDNALTKANTDSALRQDTAKETAGQSIRKNDTPSSSAAGIQNSITQNRDMEDDRLQDNGCSLRPSPTEQKGDGHADIKIHESTKLNTIKKVAQPNGYKQAVVTTSEQQDQQTKLTTEKENEPLELIELGSDDEEITSVTAKATCVDVGFRLRASNSASCVEDASNKLKLKRGNSSEKAPKSVPEIDQSSESANRPTMTAARKNTLKRKLSSSGNLSNSAEKMSGDVPTNVPSTRLVLIRPKSQSESKLPNGLRCSPSSQMVNATSGAYLGGLSSNVQSNVTSPVQPRPQAPDALRSAIAQVISQRQHLLSKRRDCRQNRLPDNINSGPCDQEEEKGTRSSYPSKHLTQQNVSTAAIESAVDQNSLAATDKSSKISVQHGKTSNEGSPAVSKTMLNEEKAGFITGHLPQLLHKPLYVNKDINFERKRAFLRAKQLAFEQFRWVRENELQQLEVELLRREMRTRENLAQMEIKLQRMHIRADIIQRMVLAHASADRIAERLKLL